MEMNLDERLSQVVMQVGQTLFLRKKCLITGNVRGTVLGSERGTGPNRGNEHT